MMGLWVICTFFFSFFPHEYGRWRMFQGIFSMQWMEWTCRLVGWVIGVYLPSYFHFRFVFLVIVYLKHVCCYNMHNKGLPVLSTYWHSIYFCLSVWNHQVTSPPRRGQAVPEGSPWADARHEVLPGSGREQDGWGLLHLHGCFGRGQILGLTWWKRSIHLFRLFQATIGITVDFGVPYGTVFSDSPVLVSQRIWHTPHDSSW